jgi:DNA replication protein DnaC
MNPLKGFPKRYENEPPATGDGWHANYAKAIATIDSGGIVVMYGTHGTGKTRMAWELAKNHKSAKPNASTGGTGWTQTTVKRPMLYTTAVNLFSDIKSSYHHASPRSEKEIVETYIDAALLVIDEIQERAETEFENSKLTSVIDSRYQHERPTIIISNYSRQKLASSLSPAIIDRIRENGCGLAFDWESFRKQKNSISSL